MFEFFPLGDFVELLVEKVFDLLVDLQLNQAALVIDWNRSAILDGLPDVVNADVLAENSAGVGVRFFNRRTSEADKRSIGKGVSHVGGETIDEIVLAPVRFVGDHDNVVAVGKQRMVGLGFRREEFMDGRKDHAAGVGL